MKCPHCRSLLNEGATTCHACGADEVADEAAVYAAGVLGCGALVAIVIGIGFIINAAVESVAPMERVNMLRAGLAAFLVAMVLIWICKRVPQKKVWVKRRG